MKSFGLLIDVVPMASWLYIHIQGSDRDAMKQRRIGRITAENYVKTG